MKRTGADGSPCIKERLRCIGLVDVWGSNTTTILVRLVSLMMAAITAKGKTIIENAAMEPEISDLADTLNKMGSKIKITNKGIIKITGVKKLNKANHKIMSDRIVAGTFVIAAVMLNKKFAVKEVEPQNLKALISSLKEMGANIKAVSYTHLTLPTILRV